MICKLKYAIGLILVLGVISSETFAQTNCSELGRKDRESLAREMIAEFTPQSVLAIRLQGYQRQLNELNKLIDAAAPDSRAEERLKKRRNEYLTSPKRWRTNLKNAFSAYYDQSHIVFYFDHDQALVKDPNAKIWLDDSGQSVKLENHTPPKFYLVQGSTSTRGLEAFMVKDDSFHDVCPPLPAYFKMNSWSTFFLIGEKEEIKKAENLAKSVQSKFSELRNLL